MKAGSVAVLGPNLFDPAGYDFHVHRTGCADITRNPITSGERAWNIEVRDELDVVEAVYSDILAENDESPNTYVNEFHFFPCVDKVASTYDPFDGLESDEAITAKLALMAKGIR